MAATWPVTLPEFFLGQAYSESPRNTVIRTENDIGLPSMRNRYTTTITDISGKMRMSQDQIAIFNTFYNVTLNKVLTFDLLNPIDSVVREMRFVSPPVITHVGGITYDVTLNLETY